LAATRAQEEVTLAGAVPRRAAAQRRVAAATPRPPVRSRSRDARWRVRLGRGARWRVRP
jgi:hypothetical protein